jgi:N-acetylmuramoyl-L-alanine amidase
LGLALCWTLGDDASAKSKTAIDPPLILLDVGHSPKRAGATSARGGKEYDFNKALAEAILQRLRENGFPNARLLDDAGRDISPAQRARNAAAAGAALLLSIHHDAAQPRYLEEWQVDGKKRRYCDRFQGFSLFCSFKSPAAERSLALAKAMGENLVAGGLAPTLHHAEPIPGENRELLDATLGVYRYDELLILKNATMPAVLLEAGVILNRREELECLRPARRELVAKAVVAAVKGFFRLP